MWKVKLPFLFYNFSHYSLMFFFWNFEMFVLFSLISTFFYHNISSKISQIYFRLSHSCFHEKTILYQFLWKDGLFDYFREKMASCLFPWQYSFVPLSMKRQSHTCFHERVLYLFAGNHHWSLSVRLSPFNTILGNMIIKILFTAYLEKF